MAPPVVLLHGLATSSARTWGETGWLDLLADAGRHTVPIDLPGHGAAPKPHDPEAFSDLEGLVLSQFPDEPVDAIGFSLGARILLTIAAANPERFHRLVVAGVGTNLFQRDEERGKRIADAIGGVENPEDPEARVKARSDRARRGCAKARVVAARARTWAPAGVRTGVQVRAQAGARTDPRAVGRQGRPCPRACR